MDEVPLTEEEVAMCCAIARSTGANPAEVMREYARAKERAVTEGVDFTVALDQLLAEQFA
jgi:hypothetical protein